MRYEIPPRLPSAAPAEDAETTDKTIVEEETKTEVIAADSPDIDAAADADSTTETPPSEQREISELDDVAAVEPVVAPTADVAAGVGERFCWFLHDTSGAHTSLCLFCICVPFRWCGGWMLPLP